MTVKELSCYHDLSRYIRTLESELAYLRSKAYGVPSAFDGTAVGGHGGCPSDRTGRYAVAIADKECELRRVKAECESERERIYAYITGEVAARDRLTASMMYWRFIQRLSWDEVAVRVHSTCGGTCRKAVCRYLDRFG